MTTPNQLSTDKIKRGNVVLLPFSNSNLQTAKLRPALIIQADELQTGLEQDAPERFANTVVPLESVFNFSFRG